MRGERGGAMIRSTVRRNTSASMRSGPGSASEPKPTGQPGIQESLMKAILAIAAIATALSGAAWAQSKSDVNLNNARQNQSGALNSQTANIGNAASGGQSKVNASGISQTQSGALNSQKLELGNAANGGRSNVNASDIKQNQSGALNSQTMSVGNAK